MTSATAPTSTPATPRRHRHAGSVVLAAAAAAVMAAPAAAQAAAPVLLEAHEMPPSSTPWTAGPVEKGAGERFCLDGLLPDSRSVHRTFRTELETTALQVVVRTKHELDARRTVSAVRAALTHCLDGFEERYPGSTAEQRYLGKVEAADGGHVHGMATSVPNSSRDINLYGVGRDGNRVTVVAWGEMGTFETAPVAAFKETVATALNKLDH